MHIVRMNIEWIMVVLFPISYILWLVTKVLRNQHTLRLGFETLATHGGCNAWVLWTPDHNCKTICLTFWVTLHALWPQLRLHDGQLCICRKFSWWTDMALVNASILTGVLIRIHAILKRDNKHAFAFWRESDIVSSLPVISNSDLAFRILKLYLSITGLLFAQRSSYCSVSAKP